MRTSLLFAGWLLSTALFAGCQPATDSTPAAVAAIDDSTGALLRGEAAGALDALRRVPAAQFVGRDADYRRCVLDLFTREAPPQPGPGPADPLARDLVQAYQRYWWQALSAPETRGAAEIRLQARIAARLDVTGADATHWEHLETRAIGMLRARGLHALMGRTAPLRELMIWRSEQTRAETVSLPEGRQAVTVHYLDDFESLGWSAYARCGRGSTGGWATQDGLFAVVPAYAREGGLSSEAFQVVFFGHEAQHFADKQRYPPMPAWEYEYRAKLVELVQGEAIGDVRLRGFSTAQGDDPDAPHPYANRQVVADLAERLGMQPADASRAQRQAAALALLRIDSRRRAEPDD